MTGKEIKDELTRISLMLYDEDEYYTTEEFAAKYGYSPSSIRQMLKREQIAGAVKVVNKWMISGDASILVRQYDKKRSIKL